VIAHWPGYCGQRGDEGRDDFGRRRGERANLVGFLVSQEAFGVALSVSGGPAGEDVVVISVASRLGRRRGVGRISAAAFGRCVTVAATLTFSGPARNGRRGGSE
jgi:hypothetical protein